MFVYVCMCMDGMGLGVQHFVLLEFHAFDWRA